jgi:hypothetical protein
MRTLYTAYGFKLGEPLTTRPCGTNTLVYMDTQKAPTKSQQRFSCDVAAKRGYDTIVFFRDDKAVKTVELW